jgi:hypothetical protein
MWHLRILVCLCHSTNDTIRDSDFPQDLPSNSGAVQQRQEKLFCGYSIDRVSGSFIQDFL